MQKDSQYLPTQSAKMGCSYIFENIGISFYRSNVFESESENEIWFQQLSHDQREDTLKYQYFESIAVWEKGCYDSVDLV